MKLYLVITVFQFKIAIKRIKNKKEISRFCLMALIVIHSLICSTNISATTTYQALCQAQEIEQRASPCHHEAHEAAKGLVSRQIIQLKIFPLYHS